VRVATKESRARVNVKRAFADRELPSKVAGTALDADA